MTSAFKSFIYQTALKTFQLNPTLLTLKFPIKILRYNFDALICFIVLNLGGYRGVAISTFLLRLLPSCNLINIKKHSKIICLPIGIENRYNRYGNPNEYESPETTHYSVVDQWGNAVSVTTTINLSYGNGCVVDGAGFFLNNEMDDFSSKPGVPNSFGLVGNEANSIEAGKRPLSSMTPTIVLKNKKPFLILGSPGGSRIITSVLQALSLIHISEPTRPY